LTDEEGRRLTEIVRRGRGHPIRVRRATIIMASASGTPVPRSLGWSRRMRTPFGM
jgi:hypothetical protein